MNYSPPQYSDTVRMASPIANGPFHLAYDYDVTLNCVSGFAAVPLTSYTPAIRAGFVLDDPNHLGVHALRRTNPQQFY